MSSNDSAKPRAGSRVPSGAELADALMRTSHELRRYAGRPYQERGWSTSRVLLMLAVDEAGTPRMGDLKDRLGITGRSITSLVDGLERDGLLRRRPDPDDRRSTRLEITQEGRRHLEEIKGLHDAHAEDTFSALSGVERTRLLEMLDRLRDHVVGRPVWDPPERPFR